MEIRIADSLAGKVRVAVIEVTGVRVHTGVSPVHKAIESFASEFRLQYGGRTVGQVPGVELSRRLYRALGLKPTKIRPSSEALIRRILKSKPFPRVNNLVDALNLAAVKVKLSIGLYDMAEIISPVELRRGREGEGFKGLGKERVNVEGRYTLADAGGPFGNPTMDSHRTRITETTTAALAVIFAPGDMERGALESAAETTASLLVRYAGGEVRSVAFVPA